jgi:hypothetical protein
VYISCYEALFRPSVFYEPTKINTAFKKEVSSFTKYFIGTNQEIINKNTGIIIYKI